MFLARPILLPGSWWGHMFSWNVDWIISQKTKLFKTDVDGYEVSTLATVNRRSNVFRNVPPRSLVGICRRLVRSLCFIPAPCWSLGLTLDADNRGKVFLRNVVNFYSNVGIELLTALAIKCSCLCDTTPCSRLKIYRRFAGKYRLHLHCRKLSQTINYNITHHHIQ